jgi:hypothetical protein
MKKATILSLLIFLWPFTKTPTLANPTVSSSRVKPGLPEIWLAGTSPFVRKKMFQESESDFFDLFKPDAPWSKSAQYVKVFMINGGVLLHESDDDVKALFADLKRRHIELGIEMGLLSGRSSDGTQQECGVGVEGFGAPGTAQVIANRIQKNGGELAYVAMDEPLWYAHHFSGKNCCQWSMERVAQDIAPRVADLRAKFPNVQIGDVEPVGTAQPADWVQEITEWTHVYQKVIGEKLAFFHADVVWTAPVWRQQYSAIKSNMQAGQIRFGVIYDGGGTGKTESDDLWTQEAEERFHLVESTPSLVPDHAIFQSWARWPHHLLPETEHGTMTNLVLKYLQTHPD